MTRGLLPRRVRAVFDPVRRDDLIPQAEALMGRECVWQFAWVIEETELGGFYAGQRAFMLIEPRSAPFLWVPESDLRATETEPQRSR